MSLAVRWAHVVAGITWVGGTLYVLRLDDRLRAPDDPVLRRRGVVGETALVELGSLFRVRRIAPGSEAGGAGDGAHFLRHEAEATWLTGLAMLALVYWLGASTYLVDPAVRPLTPHVAIALSIATLVCGWLAYALLCAMLGTRRSWFVVACVAAFVLLDWSLFHLFSGRAAALHLGAVLATIMAVNAVFTVHRAHRDAVDAAATGRRADARLAAIARTRAQHNGYLAFPVVLLMIGSHAPVLYASANGWIAVALVCASGALVRQFSVLSHSRRYVIALPVAAAVLFVAAALIGRGGGR
ncbi:MAG TPA: urate hydroxylase PuuD [Candidatus Baltobacteraceae bacterium]|nr:urate hydroxylase PuuD [Candidatus Baltobacteraceae bacterium]